MRIYWVELVLIVVGIAIVNARPKEDVYPVYSADGSSESKNENVENRKNDKLTIEDLAIVARASNEDPSLSPAVAKVADQLISSLGEMVEKDIRTPPKLKDAVSTTAKNETKVVTIEMTTSTAATVDKVEANGKFVLKEHTLAGDTSEGKAASVKKEDGVKGVAVPVIMEDEHDHKNLQKIPNVNKPAKEEKKKPGSTYKPMKETPTTTPSSGLSTWILLSDNKESTTPSPPPKRKTVAITSTKKPSKAQATTTPKSSATKPTKKTTTKPDKSPDAVSALETMVKNQKNNPASRPNQKKKGDSVESKDNDNRRVATIPPAIMIESTENSSTEPSNSEASLGTTTKNKKKTATKKRKKNKNRRKNPSEKSGDDQVIKDLIKQPKQPVGAQFYNFLSREIMPTVGLGLVGVLVTAGLAGLLGYNPFNTNTIPVRRTYESQHGYNPQYYSHGDYGESDTSKNEEVLFREVLSGMPDDSRYSMSNSGATYPESQIYNSQEQAYDTVQHPSTSETNKNTADNYRDVYSSRYDAYSSKDEVSGKYPVYSAGYVYPDASASDSFKASAKFSDETIEKQPEALYRVSGDVNTGDVSTSQDSSTSDGSWHRIGSAMEGDAHLEPGPRRLDLEKMTEQLTKTTEHKRSKRSPESILTRIVRRSNEVVSAKPEDDRENEIDFDDKTSKPASSTVETTETPTLPPSPFTEAMMEQSLMESFPSELPSNPTTEPHPSLMDVLKRLAQFKFRLGINFLKATTDALGKYLEGVQQRVEETMANDTSFPAMRYAWLGREAIREKRYQRDADDLTSES